MANKITVASIDARIDSVTYHRIPNTTITVCAIKMVNGFTVIGESACVDPVNFNVELGKEFAYEKAFGQLWVLEGYLLAERIYQSTIKEEVIGDCIDNHQ